MKRSIGSSFFKISPYIVGGLLGWLLINPPAVLDPLGPARFLFVAVLALLVLQMSTGLRLLRGLSDHLRVEPSPGAELGSEGDALVAEFEALGFQRVGPPLALDLRPTATMVCLFDAESLTGANVYRLGTIPPRVGFDAISMAERLRGELTTIADPAGGILPLGPGMFNQIFPGATPTELLHYHRDALAYLHSRGIRLEVLRAEGLIEYIRQGMRHRRAFLQSHFFTGSFRAFWRAATHSTPYLGSIRRQKGTENAVNYLLT